MQKAHLARPADELVGRAGHRRDDDGHLVAGIDLALDAASRIHDVVEVGNRCPAEFLNDARHVTLVMRYPLRRNARMRDRAACCRGCLGFAYSAPEEPGL